MIYQRILFIQQSQKLFIFHKLVDIIQSVESVFFDDLTLISRN